MPKCSTVFLILGFSLALLSCDMGPISVLDEIGTSDGMYIDEPIILEASEPQNSVQSGQDEYVCDLSRVALITSHRANDFEISYGTPSSCDENVYVFNYRTESWTQIGFNPVGMGCAQEPSTQYHLFSSMGLIAGKYMNESNQMRVRSKWGAPIIRALRLNAGYRTIPLSHFPQVTFDGITFNGKSLWLSSRWPSTIYCLSVYGAILKSFPLSSDFPFGMAFDGRFLWLADGTDRILKFEQDGVLSGQFSVPTDYPGGITWDGTNLWLSEYEGPRLHTYSIDATASCATGAAVLVDSLQTPGGGGWGLAWTGSDLLVVGSKDSLFVFSRSGVVRHAYALPVTDVSDLTWDGQAIWILNRGPKGSRGRDPLITRVRFRQ